LTKENTNNDLVNIYAKVLELVVFKTSFHSPRLLKINKKVSLRTNIKPFKPPSLI
jgi:hypothetical protein